MDVAYQTLLSRRLSGLRQGWVQSGDVRGDVITQSETSLFGSERRSCGSRVALKPPYKPFHLNAPYFCSSAATGAHFRGMKWSEFRKIRGPGIYGTKNCSFFKVPSSPIRTDHLFVTLFCLVEAVERLLNELFVPGVGLEAEKKTPKQAMCFWRMGVVSQQRDW